jgi:hypothetical protein
MWDLFGHLEWDSKRRAVFLGDNRCIYATLFAPVKEEKGKEWEEEERDNTEDYFNDLAYLAKKAKEGKLDKIPLMRKGVDEKKV